MRFKRKIILSFVLMVSLILILSFIAVYISLNQITNKQFQERLKERVYITANAYLEKDEVTAQAFEQIQREYFKTLPQEENWVIEIDSNTYNLKNKAETEDLPKSFIRNLKNFETAYFESDSLLYSGIIYNDNQGTFMVISAAVNVDGDKYLTQFGVVVFAIFIIAVISTIAISNFFAQRILIPIQDLRKKMEIIHSDSLSIRLKESDKKDELAALARTFNAMLDRLNASFQLQQHFINNASHELNTPLTIIMGETETILSKPRDTEDYIKSLSIVQSEANRLKRLIQSLMDLAMAGKDSFNLIKEKIRMDEVLFRAKEAVSTVRTNAIINLDVNSFPEDENKLYIMGHPALAEVAIQNVIHNACKFSQDKPIEISLIFEPAYVSVCVSDRGIGIPEEQIKNVGSVFFRATNSSTINGFGLGMHLTERIMHLHNGSISISSSLGMGTQVTLRWPQ